MQSDADKNMATFKMGNSEKLENDGEIQLTEIGDDTSRAKFRVERLIYTKSQFKQNYNFVPKRDSHVLVDRLQHLKRNCHPTCKCAKRILLSIFPFIGIMKEYSPRTDLLGDIVAGLTVGVMHIPQGMAYGILSNLKPVYGLYCSFFPAIIYFFLGTSKHISLGTFAVICLMIGTVVDNSGCSSHVTSTNNSPYIFTNNTKLGYSLDEDNITTTDGHVAHLNVTGDAEDDQQLRCEVGVAMAVTMVAGIYQLIMGLLRAGFVTIYLSEPLTRAFTTGAGIHVFTSQIKHVFGVSMGRYKGALKLVYMYITFFKNISKTNFGALIMATVCMIIMFSVQQWVNPKVKAKIKMPLPIELIVIVFGTIVSYFGSFSTKFEVKVVGHIPIGIPAPAVPPYSRFADVASDAMGIAIVSFAISISMANLFAKKHSYKLNSNQELMAYGATNIISSMLNSFVSAASLSRSLVQETVGGKTQIAGLVSSLLLLVVLLAVGPLFRELPNCVLAAIVIVNLKGIFLQVLDIRKLYNISKCDLMIWIVTFIAVVLTDVDYGLYIGVAFSLLTIIFRTQRPSSCILGRIPHTDIYENVSKYPIAKEIPGIKIFSFNSSLYYANAENFLKDLYKKTKCNPVVVKAARIQHQKKLLSQEKIPANENTHDPQALVEISPVSDIVKLSMLAPSCNCLDSYQVPITDIILDCMSMVFIDATGISVLQNIIKDYKDINVRLTLVRCNDNVTDMLERVGVFKKTDRPMVYVSIHDAILSAILHDKALYEQLKHDSTGAIGSLLNISITSDASEGMPKPNENSK